MQIHIHTVAGHKHSINVEPSSTILSHKAELH